MRVSHFMITYFCVFGKLKGSSYLLRAHGKGGASATIVSLSAPPPPEKIAGGFPAVVETLAGRQQAGGAAGRVNSVQSRFALRSVIAGRDGALVPTYAEASVGKLAPPLFTPHHSATAGLVLGLSKGGESNVR